MYACVNVCIIRAPIGHFLALPAPLRGGGEASSAPPLSAKLLDRVSTRRRYLFDSPEHKNSEYIAKVHVKITKDVKGHILNYLSSLASPGKVAVSSRNEADGTTWFVSRRLPILS